MSNFALENVRKKADTMLHDHALVIKKIDQTLQWERDAYYINKKNADDYMRFGYETNKKFLTSMYGISMKIVSYGVVLDADFEAVCIFKGIFHVEGAFFKRVKGDASLVERLNQQEPLINRIYQAAKKLDFESIKIKYSKDTQVLEVTIKPYAGVVVWIKFPPVTKKIPLHGDELQEIYNLSSYIQNYRFNDSVL